MPGDMTLWQFIFCPKVNVIGEDQLVTFSSRLGIRALPNPREKIDGIRRRIHFSI
jgi:hypothetical protein